MLIFFNSLTVVIKEIFISAFVTSIVVGSDVGLDVAGATSIKVVSTEAAHPLDTTFDIIGDSIINNYCRYIESKYVYYMIIIRESSTYFSTCVISSGIFLWRTTRSNFPP